MQGHGKAVRRAKAAVIVLALLLGGTISLSVALAQTTQTGGPSPSPAGAKVYFVGLQDGSTIPQHVTLHFGLVNMGVAPAGIEKSDTGHHHLLIDTELPQLDQPIPNDFNHLHFGSGQTEATIDLTPGKHTLQLLLGDANHTPHSPPVLSKPIEVIVIRTGAAEQETRNPEPETRRHRTESRRSHYSRRYCRSPWGWRRC
jgi:hypothetical protein